jgi:hypothetical protein
MHAARRAWLEEILADVAPNDRDALAGLFERFVGDLLAAGTTRGADVTR